MLVDYHLHAIGHGEAEHTTDNISSFAETAMRRGIREIGFADHAEYRDRFNFNNIAEAQERYPDVTFRYGIEADFFPGREAVTAAYLKNWQFDYVIGSVHFIDGWGFDHPDYQDHYRLWDIDRLYRTYYDLLVGAAHAKLFDIVGHLDLIKVFGFRPQGNAAGFAAPALQAIRESGMAVEINTNGRYKPVREAYPAPEILRRCCEAGIPVTFGSDAHVPENVGRDIAWAAEMAKKVGYRQVATFVKRERVMVEL